jgi:hypothetical protein
MRPAVGAYSGPRAVCGAVAQLANNAIQVIPALRRMDIFVSSSFMSVGAFKRLAMIAKKYPTRSKFCYETLGLYGRSFSCNATREIRVENLCNAQGLES